MPGVLYARVGGSWVPISSGGGASEVEIATDDPIGTNSAAELWFDSDDEPAAADSANYWNSAWGVVASDVRTGADGVFANGATVVTLPFTAVAGRRYAVRYNAPYCVMSVAGLLIMRATVSGGGGVADFRLNLGTASVQFTTDILLEDSQPAAGPQSVTIAAYPPSGTLTLASSSIVVRLTVVDIGPVTKAAVNPPAGQPQIATAGNALGIVAVGANSQGNQAVAPNTAVALFGTITYTFLAGRRYRAVAYVRAVGGGVVNNAYKVELVEGATAFNGMLEAWQNVDYINPNGYFEWVWNGDGASHTLFVKATTYSANSGNLTFYTEQPGTFYVEDVGPNQAPALPIPDTPPGWTPMTMQNNWVAYSGSQPAPVYRKIGDMVQVRGSIKNAAAISGATSACATLPVGFRPPLSHEYPISSIGSDSVSAPNIMLVGSDGVIQVVRSAQGASQPHIATKFEFQFSVTP